MPYGIAKRFGGDNAQNDAHMEHQIKAIMDASGLDKVSAIKIAKAQMAKHSAPRKSLRDYLDGKG